MAERTDKQGPKTPDPELVPDVVLEELLAAFSKQDGEAIDFDDPSIDRLLGLSDSADSTAGNVEGSAIDDTGTGVQLDTTTPAAHTEALTAASPTATSPAPAPPTAANTVPLAPAAEPPGAPAVEPAKPAKPAVKVIAIDDDDRPDAVYLDEESGSRLRDVHDDDSGGRSTIIINDLDESGSIEALPARSTGSMDPRVRARRIAVRRAKGRKRLIWVAIAAAILVVLVGAIAVLASSLFDVRKVDVQGAVYTDPSAAVGDRRRIAGRCDPVGRHAGRIERQLEYIAWVERRACRRDFPHDVFIDIRERKPIATFAGLRRTVPRHRS